MRYRYILLVVLISFGVLLSACGSSSDPTPTATASAATNPTAAESTATTAAGPTEEEAQATATTAEASPTSAEAATSPTSAATPEGSGSEDTGEKVKVTLALGFVPNVQFAPYYVAIDNGYYEDAGFDVEVQQGPNPDLLAQLGSGSIDFAVTSGDGLIPARAAGIPVTYVMAQFQKYPVGATAIGGKHDP
ncbi:MAG: ABC transporter substrate-binding protein, partial [Thermomicrobiales bacterium]|nr:ABC transporter substrate-binding protein [Thermomicrobiales bacterium]